MSRPADLPSFPSRPADAHKGSVGRVLVIAGSVSMTGAAFLCAKAALRSGAGVVVTACPETVQPVLAAKHTCVMVRPLPATAAGTLHFRALEPLLDLARGFDAVALGPGLGRHPLTLELAERLSAALEGPLVLDADALFALARSPDRALARLRPGHVLTPHPAELARLAGTTAALVQGDRLAAAARVVERTSAVVVLKGHGTLVAQRGRAAWTNPSGNPGMATAGAGDVLAGVTAALLAAGLPAWDAARLAVWLHGRGGDLVAAQRGLAPLIASDIIDGVALAIREEEARA